MKCMIQRGIDINAKNERGNDALHILCKLNSSGNLLDAINAGDKNYRNENALHILCKYNLNETLRDAIHFLMTNGINVHDKEFIRNNKDFDRVRNRRECARRKRTARSTFFIETQSHRKFKENNRTLSATRESVEHLVVFSLLRNNDGQRNTP